VDDRHVHCRDGFVNTDPRLLLEDDVVCEVNIDYRKGGLLTETDKANLKLIAAAPDLLEACQGLLKVLPPGAPDTIALEGEEILQSDVRRAIETIRKIKA